MHGQTRIKVIKLGFKMGLDILAKENKTILDGI
jgi:hypothetical protein